jgi:hypothetical protein
MSENVNIKFARQRAWRAVVGDGLLDLFFGLILILVAWMLGNGIVMDVDYDFAPFINVLVVVCIVGFIQARERLIYPRVGHVYMLPKRVKLVIVFTLLLIMIGLVLLTTDLFGFSTDQRAAFTNILEGFVVGLSTVIVLAFVLASILTGYRRYILYAAIAVLSGIVGLINLPVFALHSDLRMVIFAGALGIIMTISGAIAFVRFLRDNPVLDTDQGAA